MAIENIITFIIALGGWFVAALVAWLNYKSKVDEVFFESLELLSGKTPRRNVGIAVIEAYWSHRRFRHLCVSLLSNSAIYLLLESRQEDAAHELNNLYRIINLLLNTKRVTKKERFYYESLLSAVQKAQMKPTVGLSVPFEKLQEWDRTLADLLGIPLLDTQA